MARKKFKLAATIFDKRGRAIAHGQNDYEKSHPLQYHFAKLAGRPEAIFLHAEIHALTKLRNWDQAHRIRVERYDDQGNPLLAKPCEICEYALRQAGISIVEYTQ